jgi:hypothetical protein
MKNKRGDEKFSITDQKKKKVKGEYRRTGNMRSGKQRRRKGKMMIMMMTIVDT